MPMLKQAFAVCLFEYPFHIERLSSINIMVLLISVKLYTNEEDCNLPSERRKYPTPHKHEVISCLGIGGKWVTSQFDLQVKLTLA